MNSTIKRVLSFMLALTMVVLLIPFTAQKASAAEVKDIVTEGEVIKKACELLGAPYSHEAAANYADPNTTGANFKSAATMKSIGTDCTGMIYWALGSLGITMSWAGQDQYPVPFSGERWTAIANAGGATINRNGKSGTIHATKTQNIVATDWWKYCSPGSVVSTMPDDWSNDHGAIYIGEFASVAALKTYLSSIGVTGVDSYIKDQGNGNTHWTIEENYGYGQCVITNPSRVSKGTAYYTDIVTWDIPTKPDDYISYIKKVDTAGTALAGATFGVWDNANCTGTRIYTITTNANGIAVLPETHSPQKDYWAKEVSAPAGYAINTNPVKMTEVEDGSPIPSNLASSTVKDTPLGNLQITKNAESSGSYQVKQGWVFTVKGSDGSTRTCTTNANGIATLNNLPVYSISGANGTATAITYTITETGMAANTYVDTTTSVAVTLTSHTPGQAVQTKTVNWNNRLKKFKVTVQKVDSDTQTAVAQGDATLAGAVYGLYRGDILVAQYTTDAQGKFTTASFPCGTDYYFQEITPSQGYLLDTTKYNLPDANPANFTTENNTLSDKTYDEDVIKGVIAVEKFYEDDNGTARREAGAQFQIYLKSAGSYDAAKEAERDILTTDSRGFAESKELPYGTYTLHQISGVEGREFVADRDYTISNNNDYKLDDEAFINETIKNYIKVVKVDRETGLVIPLVGAEFEIYDSNQELMHFSIFNGSEYIDKTSFVSNNAGFIVVPDQLKYGSYYVKEINAPTGYVLDSSMRPFTVSANSDTRTEVIGTITYSDLQQVDVDNIAQKGTITVYKKGEMLTHVSGDAETGYIPEYGEQYLAGAVFEVRAAEDIITGDGTIRAEEGELVATLTTGTDGKAATGELYLGKYTIKEVQAPTGYVLGNIEEDVVLEYAGQTVEVTSLSKTYSNDRQKVEFNLLKGMEIDDTFNIGENGELQNVVFALYAKEEITAVDGTTIPANGLIFTEEPLTPDANGNVLVTADLPIGTYYFKEIETDEHYVINPTEFTVSFEYQGQDVAKVYKTANDGEVVMNNLIRGQITIYKINEDDEPLAGVKFGLYSPDDTNFENPILTQETNADGIAVFSEIPYGNWVIREISTLEGYVKDETATPYDITTDGQEEEQTVVNDYLRVYITKVNEEDTSVMLTEAEFSVYSDSNNNGKYDKSDELVTKFVEDDVISGLYVVKGLHYGTYFVKETKAPYGYNLDNNAYKIVIDANTKDFYLSNEKSGLYFTNKPIRGGIEIDKYDSENKDNKLDGAEFTLYEAVQAEVESELGTVSLNGNADIEGNPKNAYYGIEADENGVIGFTDAENDNRDLAIVLSQLKHDASVTIPSTLKRALVRQFGGEYFRVARIKLTSGSTEAVNDYVYLTVGDLKAMSADRQFTLSDGITDDYVYMIMPVNYEEILDALDEGNIPDKMTLISEESISMLLAQGITNDSVTITQILHELVPGKEIAVLRPQGDGRYELRDILFGDYFIRETKAPEGFLIDDNYYLVTILNQDEIINITNDLENLGFSNVPITGTFVITKLDAVDGKPIPNAGFRIRDVDGNIVAEGYTDENGEFSVELRYGKYTYEEFDAPEGYLLNDEIGTFEILENGQIVKATMSDERMPDTGDTTSIIPVVVLMTIAACGIVVFTKRKENIVSE